MTPGPERRAPEFPWGWAAGWTLAAALLRAPGLRTDLWLDEIWSLRLAQAAGSVADILYRAPTSNNHILVTLWLYAVRASGSEALYRLPSFLAGLAAIPAAMAAARRFGGDEALVAAPLAALWYPLLPYSTEARGYAIASAAALAAWAWNRDGRRAWAFGAACAAGLLSQLIFLYIYAALVVAEFAGPPASAVERVRRHALPLATLILIAAPQALRLYVDGPDYRLATVLAEAAGLLWATPASMAGACAALGLTLLAAFLAWPALKRDGDWVFCLSAAGLPLAAALSRPQVLFSRYFLPAAACFLPVLACALVRLWKRPGARPAAVMLGLAYASLHAAACVPFWRYGRGGYRAAVEFLESQGAARVAGDHDFRNGMVFQYYAPRVPPGRLIYVEAGEALRGGADWYLVHRESGDEPQPPQTLTGPLDRPFQLVNVFPHAGPSGWDWYLYRCYHCGH